MHNNNLENGDMPLELYYKYNLECRNDLRHLLKINDK